MSYETFCDKVRFLVAKSGISETPRFCKNGGNFTAQCDDVLIIGKSTSRNVKVTWGYGQHTAVSRLV